MDKAYLQEQVELHSYQLDEGFWDSLKKIMGRGSDSESRLQNFFNKRKNFFQREQDKYNREFQQAKLAAADRLDRRETVKNAKETQKILKGVGRVPKFLRDPSEAFATPFDTNIPLLPGDIRNKPVNIGSASKAGILGKKSGLPSINEPPSPDFEELKKLARGSSAQQAGQEFFSKYGSTIPQAIDDGDIHEPQAIDPDIKTDIDLPALQASPEPFSADRESAKVAGKKIAALPSNPNITPSSPLPLSGINPMATGKTRVTPLQAQKPLTGVKKNISNKNIPIASKVFAPVSKEGYGVGRTGVQSKEGPEGKRIYDVPHDPSEKNISFAKFKPPVVGAPGKSPESGDILKKLRSNVLKKEDREFDILKKQISLLESQDIAKCAQDFENHYDESQVELDLLARRFAMKWQLY